MDVPAIASAATAQAQLNLQQQVDIAVLKKSMDQQAAAAMQMIDALIQPAPSPEGSLGHNLDIKA